MTYEEREAQGIEKIKSLVSTTAHQVMQTPAVSTEYGTFTTGATHTEDNLVCTIILSHKVFVQVMLHDLVPELVANMIFDYDTMIWEGFCEIPPAAYPQVFQSDAMLDMLQGWEAFWDDVIA